MGDDSKIERTFQFEEALPSLPVPELDKTLPKYLESGEYGTQQEKQISIRTEKIGFVFKHNACFEYSNKRQTTRNLIGPDFTIGFV